MTQTRDKEKAVTFRMIEKVSPCRPRPPYDRHHLGARIAMSNAIWRTGSNGVEAPTMREFDWSPGLPRLVRTLQVQPAKFSTLEIYAKY